MRWFILGSVLVGYMAVGLYAGDINNAKEQGGKFLLRYLLSSQSAIMWQAALTVLAFVLYALGTLVTWKTRKAACTFVQAKYFVGYGIGFGLGSSVCRFCRLAGALARKLFVAPRCGTYSCVQSV